MKPEIIDGFYVVGDEAFTPEEWERFGPKNPVGRPRIYDTDEERLEATRRSAREHMRRRRVGEGYQEYRVVGSLHDLGCTGPTRTTGCRRCGKTLVLRRVEP